MIKGLIFDLDGTLIDSIGDIHYSVNLALNEYGYKEKSYEFVKAKTGKGFKKLIEDCIDEKISDSKIDEITKTYSEYYGQHYNEKTKSYDGVHETLRYLQKLNIKLAVNSNKKDSYTKNLMKSIFKDINLIAVYGEREGIKNKPDPTTANEIVEIMGLKKDEILYVGDSEVDMKTAKNAELGSIGCLWGFRTKETLMSENPSYIIRKPQEIIEIIEGSK